MISILWILFYILNFSSSLDNTAISNFQHLFIYPPNQYAHHESSKFLSSSLPVFTSAYSNLQFIYLLMFVPFFCFGSHIIFFRFFIDHDLFSFVSLFVILYQIFFQLFLGSVILILNEFLLTQMICSVFVHAVSMVSP